MRRWLVLLLTCWLVACGGGRLPWPSQPAPAVVPPVIVEPAPEPTPAPPSVLRASGEKLLDYRGCLANYFDSANRPVWTPALPGASAEIRQEWYAMLRAHGCTHIPIGGFDPGFAYPGMPFENPDWRQDAAAIRGLVEELLSTDAGDGYGFRPVIFTDGGPPNPLPRLRALFPVLAKALEGLDEYVIVVPAGWEPVVGAFTSYEVSRALCEWHEARPQSVMGYHGSPDRLVGSSNPVEPDDPWQGGESEFYKTHCGEFIQIALFQTRHGEIYDDCDEDSGEGCWLDRWQDYVQRLASPDGWGWWRKLKLVAYETCAFERFRGWVSEQQCTDVARRMERVAAKWHAPVGFGNGLP